MSGSGASFFFPQNLKHIFHSFAGLHFFSGRFFFILGTMRDIILSRYLRKTAEVPSQVGDTSSSPSLISNAKNCEDHLVTEKQSCRAAAVKFCHFLGSLCDRSFSNKKGQSVTKVVRFTKCLIETAWKQYETNHVFEYALNFTGLFFFSIVSKFYHNETKKIFHLPVRVLKNQIPGRDLPPPLKTASIGVYM